jgi:hypothetical protein
MLVRVPAASIEDRGTYEFFAGLDSGGEPVVNDPAKRLAIYEDRTAWAVPANGAGAGTGSLVYGISMAPGRQMPARNHCSAGEAPQPWGRGTCSSRSSSRSSSQACSSGTAPKWFHNGGRDFTLIFSGTGSNDSWNTIDGTFATQ